MPCCSITKCKSPMAPSRSSLLVVPSLTTVQARCGCGCPPILEVAGKFFIGDDVGVVDFANGLAAGEHVLEHGPATNGKERLGRVFGERIQPRGVAGGEDDLFHEGFKAPYGKCPARTAAQGHGIARARPYWIRIGALAGRVPGFRCILTGG